MQGPDTRQSLLYMLRDTGRQEVWTEFVELYQPLIYSVAVARGLQHSDALDIVQEVFCSVANAIKRFEPDSAKGSFRGWLFRITRNLVINRVTRGERFCATGDSRIQFLLNSEAEKPDEASSLYDLQMKKQIFRWAARRVKSRVSESTWQAFWLTAVDGVSITSASDRLNKSNGAIRIARCRVMVMLKEHVDQFKQNDSNTYKFELERE